MVPGMLACSGAIGQWYDYRANVEIMLKSQYTSAMNMNLATARSLRDQQQGRSAKLEKNKKKKNARKENKSAQAHSKTTLDFTVDPAVTHRAQENYLKHLTKADPAAAEQFAAALQGQDVPIVFRGNLAIYGLDSHNVADVMTAYWVILWAIANKQSTDNLSKQAVQAVQHVVRKELAENSTVRGLDSDTRQSVTELMMYDAVLADASYHTTQTQRRKDLLIRLSDSVYKRVLQNGVDLRSMNLTDSGFTSR